MNVALSFTWGTLLAAAAGYLLGSISFARIVTHLVAPDLDISRTRVVMPDTGEVLESDAVSPTVVRLHLGSRYGCLAGLFDMAKVAIPAGALRMLYPDTYYYIAFAALAVIGHIWPLYYGFQGGRGLSPITGGFVVMAPLGTVVCTLLSAVVGFALHDRVISGIIMLLLMVPWIWFTTYDWVLLAYTVAMAALFISAMLPELRQYARIKREGRLDALGEATIEGGPRRGSGKLRDDADLH